MGAPGRRRYRQRRDQQACPQAKRDCVHQPTPPWFSFCNIGRTSARSMAAGRRCCLETRATADRLPVRPWPGCAALGLARHSARRSRALSRCRRMSMSLPLEPVLAHVEANLEVSIERWKDLLRIPSIGTDPAHRADTRRAAEWLVGQLAALGFDATARDTPGQPIVVGHHPGPGAASVFIEGEEESGSPSLEPFLESHRNELRADVCVVSDTNMWNIETPALATLLRGLLYTEITLSGPAHDLHSGLYGGAVPNPLNLLSRILGQLHDAEGRVQVPGFYDDVEELNEDERRRLAELPFDEAAFLGSAGLTVPTGEAGRPNPGGSWGPAA